MELKDELDEIHEGHTASAYVSKFLAKISDPNCTEDFRALERSGASLAKSAKVIRRVQRKISLEREKVKVAQIEAIQQSQQVEHINKATHPEPDTQISNKYLKGTPINFSKHKNSKDFITVPRDEWRKIGSKCRNDIINHNKRKREDTDAAADSINPPSTSITQHSKR